jgi:DNA-binding NtrC family response regulator
MSMSSVLLVEDKSSLRKMMATAMEGAGHTVTQSGDGAEAVELVRRQRFHLVVTDLRLPHRNGIDILKAQRESDPSIPVLIMTVYGTVEDAVEAMKLGAFDFVPKPVDIARLLLLVDRALERRRLVLENTLLKEEVQATYGVPRIIAESEAMKGVGREIERVAPTDATVLFTGESGTGKEAFARAVHQRTRGSDRLVGLHQRRDRTHYRDRQDEKDTACAGVDEVEQDAGRQIARSVVQDAFEQDQAVRSRIEAQEIELEIPELLDDGLYL